MTVVQKLSYDGLKKVFIIFEKRLNAVFSTRFITALASATVVFIECMSMAFAYEYDQSCDCPLEVGSDVIIVRLNKIESPLQLLKYEQNIYDN